MMKFVSDLFNLFKIILNDIYSRAKRLYYLLCVNLIIIVYVLVANNRINHRSFPSSSSAILNDRQNFNLIDRCRWKFHHYSPSSWELFWYNNISILQNHVCPTLMETDQLTKSVSALTYIISLQKTLSTHSSASSEQDALLSKMYYRSECSQSSQLVSQSIEPLIGLLRDPLTICSYTNLPSTFQTDAESALQSKRFFLLGPSAPYQNFERSTASIAPWLYRPGAQKILFDIGSSYFNGAASGTSRATFGMRWFYEYFLLHSLHFDRIIAFERAQYPPETYWNQIPEDIIGSLTFINVGVENKGKFNPWNILKSIAKEDDYVVIKLDIDTPSLEEDLVTQVANDISISSLIDEMFFEMHVRVNEMVPYWNVQTGELKDTYILFTKLRQLGIRMHSWP